MKEMNCAFCGVVERDCEKCQELYDSISGKPDETPAPEEFAAKDPYPIPSRKGAKWDYEK